jgi:protein-tyrosine phosphatase
MDWITEQIAIGNYKDACTPPPHIDSILCLKEGCGCWSNEEIDVLSTPLRDGPGNDPHLVGKAVRFIDETVRSGGRILIHCHAGRSRSVAIAARYLIVSRGITGEQALELISKKREIQLTPGIEELLHQPTEDDIRP